MSLTRSSGFGVMVESSPAWEMLMNVPAVSFIILNAKKIDELRKVGRGGVWEKQRHEPIKHTEDCQRYLHPYQERSEFPPASSRSVNNSAYEHIVYNIPCAGEKRDDSVYLKVDFYDIPDKPVPIFAYRKAVGKVLRNICGGFVVAHITTLQHIVFHANDLLCSF